MISVAGHEGSRTVQVVSGVDTHQDEHVAVAIDRQGVRLAARRAPATTFGYTDLERWSRTLGDIHAFGIEGTGSYGAGVSRFLSGRGYTVVEVNRPDRSVRYRKGKSDPTDAEMAARAVLAGVDDATPKSGQGEVEMIRMLKSAKDSAVKARTQAINQMKALVVTAPAGLRETLAGLASGALATRCKSFRIGRLGDPTAAAKYALRWLAGWPLLSTQQGDPRFGVRAGTAHPDGSDSPGQCLRHRTRHRGGPPDRCWEQPGTPPLRGRLRRAVRSEPDTCFLWSDQPTSAEPRWRPSGQFGSLSHRCGSASS